MSRVSRVLLAFSLLALLLIVLPSTAGASDNLPQFQAATERVVLSSPLFADPVADGFDYPVGKPNGSGYAVNGYRYLQWVPDADGVYVYHPGVDWNRLCSGVDCDLGDPIYAIGNGVIVDARYFSNGYGNVVQIRHTLPDGSQVWSQYAHLREFTNAVAGQSVVRGQQIGTIGKGANNQFGAHLHFELRTQYRAANAWVGGWSESEVRKYYADPVAFINEHRRLSLDWDITNGHFYTQTGLEGKTGYRVTNEGGIGFWAEFKRLGGVQALGYPISDRFLWNGFVCQAFQRAVLQWRPERTATYLVNVFDLLHEAGRDAWLQAARQTPKPLGAEFDAGLTASQSAQKRLALLDTNNSIRTQYYAVVGDAVQMNGLPTSAVTDMGNNYTVRCQRIVIQQWKEAVPWATKGQVTIGNGGDIAKEAGLLPPGALVAPRAGG